LTHLHTTAAVVVPFQEISTPRDMVVEHCSIEIQSLTVERLAFVDIHLAIQL
jgi:hypothetical protein